MERKGTRRTPWRGVLAITLAVAGLTLPSAGRAEAAAADPGCAPAAAASGAVHLAAARKGPQATLAARAKPRRNPAASGRTAARPSRPPGPAQRPAPAPVAEPASAEAILTLYTCVAAPMTAAAPRGAGWTARGPARRT